MRGAAIQATVVPNSQDAIVKRFIVSPALDIFGLRCWARAYLVDHGLMFLQEGVDGLQDFALSIGLVDLLGQDAVQAIMTSAFDLRRHRA
jgi:hypothetical protein